LPRRPRWRRRPTHSARWLRRYRAEGLVGLVATPQRRRERSYRRISQDSSRAGVAQARPLSRASREVGRIAADRGIVRRPMRPSMRLCAGLSGADDFGARRPAAFETAMTHPRHRPKRECALQPIHALDILMWTRTASARPWLTIVIDDSRAIAGYMAFLGAPSALHTAWPCASDLAQANLMADPRHSAFSTSIMQRLHKRPHRQVAAAGTVNTELLPGLPGIWSRQGRKRPRNFARVADAAVPSREW